MHCEESPGRGLGPTHQLSDPQLIQARGVTEELQTPSAKHLSLPPRPGSVFSYYVRDPEGTVRFADNSSGQPSVLRHLALLRAGSGAEGVRAAGVSCPAQGLSPRRGESPYPKRTFPLERACAWARSTSSMRLMAARKSIVSRRRRAFSERSSRSSCLASAPNSTVAAMR